MNQSASIRGAGKRLLAGWTPPPGEWGLLRFKRRPGHHHAVQQIERLGTGLVQRAEHRAARPLHHLQRLQHPLRGDGASAAVGRWGGALTLGSNCTRLARFLEPQGGET